MSVTIIINPDLRRRSGPIRRVRASNWLPPWSKRTASRPTCSSPSAAATRESSPRRRVGRGARLVHRLGRRRNAERSRFGARLSGGAARHRPVGIGKRPRARAGRELPPGAGDCRRDRAPSRATIDLGEVDDRLFVNVAGFGFDAHVAAEFDKRGGRRGFAGYVGDDGARARQLRAADATRLRPPKAARCRERFS